jgi:tetratricopeptide (TPR) repeat protein
MQRELATVFGSLLLASVLPAVGRGQMVGMSTETTRQLNEVTEMGRTAAKIERLPRSLTFEEADDPTIVARPVPPHEPLAAARKAAQKGERLSKKNRHDDAVQAYREAVAKDPHYFEAWNNLALELEAAGKKDEAEATLRRLTQMEPEHVLGFTNLATLLCDQKRYAEAEAAVRLGLKLHNYSFKANYMLGRVLIDENRWTDEARAKLEYAQVKYPEAKALLDKWPRKPSAN